MPSGGSGVKVVVFLDFIHLFLLGDCDMTVSRWIRLHHLPELSCYFLAVGFFVFGTAWPREVKVVGPAGCSVQFRLRTEPR